MVGAQVSVAPPLGGAAPGAPRSSALNLRQGRGQPAVVTGVQVPAVPERPSGVPVRAGPPLVVPGGGGDGFGRQQVVPDEVLVQLRVLVLPVAAGLAVVPRRFDYIKAPYPRWDWDGDWLARPAAKPASFGAKAAGHARSETGPVGLQPPGVWRRAPGPVPSVVPPLRFPNVHSDGACRRVGVKVLLFAPAGSPGLAPLPSGHGGLQVDHLEFLLGQSLLEPLQVAFAYLQLGLDVIHGV